MKNFIQPKKTREKISQEKIDKFITLFNRELKKGETGMNDGLTRGFDCYLNDAEFKIVVKQAKKNGYILTRYDDNYQTTSYDLKPINQK